MATIRPCREDERDTILAIVNAGAEAYRGVIPEDRWHEPYMSGDALGEELRAGVTFSAYEDDGEVLGVMGIQRLPEVDLIRHAYVRPEAQGRGVGTALLDHLRRSTGRQVLVGTWAAARWAIGFYERNGFELVSAETKTVLLQRHWTIPERQIETSVVLASPPLAAS